MEVVWGTFGDEMQEMLYWGISSDWHSGCQLAESALR